MVRMLGRRQRHATNLEEIMPRITLLRVQTLTLVIAGIFVTASPTFADKPSKAGKDHAGRHERTEHRGPGQERIHKEQGEHGRDNDHPKGHKYFANHHRTVISNYYTEQFRSGHCPPGLVKKHNGCLPPGQARKWIIGQPLPRDLVYYELPPAIVVELGPPPIGHRYVRVANDVLLLAVGTGMIVDAIQDLGR